MANIPLQSISFPGLSDKDTTPVVDNTLTQAGAAADAKKVGDEIGAIKNDLSELEHTYSAFVVETETGAVASFTDGADDVPVKDLTVAIEPVQDLHGQSSPYPAGGGKNICDEANLLSATGWTETNGVYSGGNNYLHATFSYESGGFPGMTFESNTSYTVSLKFKSANAEKLTVVGFQYTDGTRSATYMQGTQEQTITFTSSDDKSIDFLFFSYGSTDTVYISDMQVEKGTTATAYAPYSNICPISGWTGANVTRTGKNLVNIPPCTIEQAGSVYPSSPLPQALPAGTYTIGITSSAEAAWSVGFRDASDNIVGSFASNQALAGRQTKTGTLSATVTKVSIYVNAGTTLSDIMFEFGSTASAYEPFVDSDTVSVDWTTEVGTVYGGTLDVTTGVLTVDRAYALLNDPDKWGEVPSGATVTYKYTDSFNNRKLYSTSYEGLICSMMSVNPNTPRYTARWLSSVDLQFGLAFDMTTPEVSLAEIRTLASNSDISIVYDIATPQTYQLTPEEVKTVLGQNNIFADCGDVNVQYRADTKLYIDKVLNT